MTTNETVTVKPLADIAAEWMRKAQELMELGNVQAALINEKNGEIASLKQQVRDLEAALSECIAGGNDYADAICNDCEDGGRGVEGQGE